MIQTQLLIIGQGLAGSLLSWELWKKGVDFRIVDPQLRYTASKAAAGLFHPLAARKMRPAKRIELLLSALKGTYAELEKELKVKLLFEKPAARLIQPELVPEWEEAMKDELKDYAMKILPAGCLPGVNPGKALVLTRDSGFAEVSGLVYAMARWLKEKGLLIEANLDYEKIKLETGNVFVNDLIEAKTIVFCEGPGGLNNPWFKDYGLSANKGEVLEIMAPGLVEKFILRDEIFLLPLGQGRFRAGATYNHQSLDHEPTGQGLLELSEKLDRMLEVPYEVVDHWAGVRPVSRDRSPILGFHPLHPQLAIFNGLGSKGVLQAPWCAEQLRKLLTEKNFSLPDEVQVSRFLRKM